MGYGLRQKSGSLGESGGELSSDDKSVNVLHSESLSDMLKMDGLVVYKAEWCGVAIEAWTLYNKLLAQLPA